MSDEWNDGPLPEGGPGARIEVDVEHDAIQYAPEGGRWRSPDDTVGWAFGEECDHAIRRWRWLQKPGELEELRERVGSVGRLMGEHFDLERIVGEVQQALAGKSAGECVTDEGRAVAALMHIAESESVPGGVGVLRWVRSACDENGWTS